MNEQFDFRGLLGSKSYETQPSRKLVNALAWIGAAAIVYLILHLLGCIK